MEVVKLENIYKSFGDKHVLIDFSLSVSDHEFVVIKGKSGAGKSTLLNIIGLLERCDRGNITICNQSNVKPFTRNASNILKSKLGYLFQNFALIEDETVLYNMKIAIEHQKLYQKQLLIQNALKEVGLDGFETKKVYKCSGGEQQRIAIARLLIKPCELILADEPTGSLDKENKLIVFDLLLKLKQMGKSLIVVTHDEDLVKLADKVITL